MENITTIFSNSTLTPLPEQNIDAVVFFVILCFAIIGSTIVLLFVGIKKGSCLYSVLVCVKIKVMMLCCCWCKKDADKIIDKDLLELNDQILV